MNHHKLTSADNPYGLLIYFLFNVIAHVPLLTIGNYITIIIFGSDDSEDTAYALLGLIWIIVYFVVLLRMTRNVRFRWLLLLAGFGVAVITPILIYS